jgi:lactoylglutathione lyase
LKEFYFKYFKSKSNEGYFNENKGFSSYFLSFEDGSRIEIMNMEGILSKDRLDQEYMGYCHLAMSVGTMFDVMKLTKTLADDGYKVIGEPRTTGDGYFESVILDPDGNRIEITR